MKASRSPDKNPVKQRNGFRSFYPIRAELEKNTKCFTIKHFKSGSSSFKYLKKFQCWEAHVETLNNPGQKPKKTVPI